MTELDGHALLRYWSRELRDLGFQDGAPIERAGGEFTLDDLKAVVFDNGPESAVTFVTAVDGLDIRVAVTTVRKAHDLPMRSTIIRDIFFDDVSDDFIDGFNDNRCWIIGGYLEVPHPSLEYMIAVAESWPSGEQPFDDRDGEEQHRRVLAVVAFGKDGRLLSAIVQTACRADHLLRLPPL
jgi:hypothetical protein